MDKKQKRRQIIKNISKHRFVSLSVAAHIYNCWPRKKQQQERAKLNTKPLNKRL